MHSFLFAFYICSHSVLSLLAVAAAERTHFMHSTNASLSIPHSVCLLAYYNHTFHLILFFVDVIVVVCLFVRFFCHVLRLCGSPYDSMHPNRKSTHEDNVRSLCISWACLRRKSFDKKRFVGKRSEMGPGWFLSMYTQRGVATWFIEIQR